MRGDKKFILALNRPLAIIKRPFAPVARELGWPEDALLKTIREYKRKGLIRRLGLVLAHRNIGLKSNVLVAWKVPGRKLKAAAGILAGSAQVSHCYQRKTYPGWPYNVYTMIHANNRQGCLRGIEALSRASGIRDYRALFTLQEFKKTKAGIWRSKS